MRKTIRIVDDRQSKKKSILIILIFNIVIYGLLFGLGVLADSAPMQWFGFIILIGIFILAGVKTEQEFLTIDEAQKRLKEIAAEEAALNHAKDHELI